MYPKPLIGVRADDPFERGVVTGSGVFDVVVEVAGIDGLNRGFETELMTFGLRIPQEITGNDRRSRTQSEHGHALGGRRRRSEEGNEDRFLANRILIGQNTDDLIGTQRAEDFARCLMFLDRDIALERPPSRDQGVHSGVVDRSGQEFHPMTVDRVGEHRKFPGADVPCEDDRPAAFGDGPFEVFQSFVDDEAFDVGPVERGEAGKFHEQPAQVPEDSAHYPFTFLGGEVRHGDLEIPESGATLARGQMEAEPRDRSAALMRDGSRHELECGEERARQRVFNGFFQGSAHPCYFHTP